MKSWRKRIEGILPATDARYAILFPISADGSKGKVLWFRNMEGVKKFLGDEHEQKVLLPFRLVHAREMREKLHKASYAKEMCCDEFPDDARAEVFELRADGKQVEPVAEDGTEIHCEVQDGLDP